MRIDIRKYLNGDPDDLIEVYFHEVSESSWKSLFDWMKGRVTLLDCQYGRIPISDFSLNRFLSEELSYSAHIECSNGFELVLSIIENNELTIDIEFSSIDSEDDFSMFISCINEIASVLNSKNYIICPEFQKNNAFYINGEFL